MAELFKKIPAPPRDVFTAAWTDLTLTAAQLEKQFGVTRFTLKRFADEYDLPPRHSKYARKFGEEAPCPTPEEIKERAAEIRRGWTAEMYQKRTVPGWEVPIG